MDKWAKTAEDRESDLIRAITAIKKEARKQSPDPDRIYALASDALEENLGRMINLLK